MSFGIKASIRTGAIPVRARHQQPGPGLHVVWERAHDPTTGYGVGFTSIPTNAGKMFIRIIALVKNTSTQAIVNVRVTGRVETRPA